MGMGRRRTRIGTTTQPGPDLSFVLIFFSDEVFLNHRKEPSSTDRRSLDPPWFTMVERSSSVPLLIPEPTRNRCAPGCETNRISSPPAGFIPCLGYWQIRFCQQGRGTRCATRMGGLHNPPWTRTSSVEPGSVVSLWRSLGSWCRPCFNPSGVRTNI